MPHSPLHAAMARAVSIPIISFFLLKSQMVSRMRTRGSLTDATRSRVSSSDLPTFTTTSSHTSRTDRIAGTIGKSSLIALRTSVKPESISGRWSGSELQIMEPAIQAVRGVELGVHPPLHHLALAQHDNLIGVLHGGETVRDDQHGAVFHQAIDGILHQPLRLGVELAG